MGAEDTATAEPEHLLLLHPLQMLMELVRLMLATTEIRSPILIRL